MTSNERDSPFAHLLSTNRKLSEAETRKVHEFLKSPEEELAALQTRLHRLQSRSDKLESVISQHNALLSPIRRIPEDVLREIFYHCLPGNHLPGRNLAEAPLLLTNVCRSWRQVAITTPSLWNSIHIQLPMIYVCDESFLELTKTRLEGVERWLGRSGILPLSIFFGAQQYCTCSSDSEPKTQGELHQAALKSMFSFVGLFLSFFSRWKSVAFYVPEGALALKEYSLSYTDLSPSPYFQELEVGRTAIPMRPDPNDPMHRKPDADNELLTGLLRLSTLRKLVLGRAEYNILKSAMPKPFGHLSRLKITTSSSRVSSILSPNDTIDMLRTCYHSLQYCFLDVGTREWPGVQSSGEELVLPHLKTLNIRLRIEDGIDKFEGLFEFLRAPQLQHVAFHAISAVSGGFPPFGPSTFENFYTFLQKSQCDTHLTALSLSIPIPPQTLVGWLRTLSALKHLRINNPVAPLMVRPFTAEFLDSLSSNDEGFICPQLERVEFKGCRPTLHPQLLHFAQTRKTMSLPLRTYFVDFWEPIPDDDMEAVTLALESLEETMFVVWRAKPARLQQHHERDPHEGLDEVYGEGFFFPDPDNLDPEGWRFTLSY